MNKKFINFIIFLLVLQGCSPVYKVVYDYTPPKSKSSQQKLMKCYSDKKICLLKCSKSYQSCKQKAKFLTQDEYNQKLKEYEERLSIYKRKLRKKEELEERVTFYKDVCQVKHDKYACLKEHTFKSKLNELRYLYRPIKPNKSEIFENVVRESCQINCGCEDLFRSCYIANGGIVSSHRVCIKNCD